MPYQYLRKIKLTLISGESALDLSALRIVFNVSQGDMETPNNALIRVYNLSDTTAQKAQKEYQQVILEAGYEQADTGIIFIGTIKQVRKGRENPTDTYLDILAADGDQNYNFSVINKSVAASETTPSQLIGTVATTMNLPQGYVDLPPTSQNAQSRGKVMFGMSRQYMRDVATTAGSTWSIQDGKIQIIPLTSYKPGEAVVLNDQTGMIGLPEQTQGGIAIRCLLNPKIKVGGLVQIDNKSIQRAFNTGFNRALYTDGRLENVPGYLPDITNDGFYRVYVCEYVGDTRGRDWYSKLVCLGVDRTTDPANSVAAYSTSFGVSGATQSG